MLGGLEGARRAPSDRLVAGDVEICGGRRSSAGSDWFTPRHPLRLATPLGVQLVLGFGLALDLAVLARSFPTVQGFRRVAAALDVADLCAHVDAAAAQQGGGLSLTGACRAWLGAPLDKAEQLSDWTARPLRQAQLLYAANDAHCLVRLFDALRTHLRRYGANRVGGGGPGSGGGRRSDDESRAEWEPLLFTLTPGGGGRGRGSASGALP